MSFDPFGEGFDCGAEVGNFGSETGQGSSIGLSGAVFVDGSATAVKVIGWPEVARSVQTRSTRVRVLSPMRARFER